MRRGVIALALLASVAGCNTYAETVRCGTGLVLDENDRCVPPPAPDGGTVTSCADLCDVIPTWTDGQRTCVTDSFAMLGTLPASCRDLTTTDDCSTCVADTGASDTQCMAAPALCPP